MINKDEEYYQNKQLFKQSYASVVLIPPKHTGLPADVVGTITMINDEHDLYSVQLEDGRIVHNIPINYLRSDDVLCSGKQVMRVTGEELLTGRKFKVPTFQRRYAWKDEDWKQLYDDIKPNYHHLMGGINVYQQDDRAMVVDGQQRLTTLLLILAAARIQAIRWNN